MEFQDVQQQLSDLPRTFRPSGTVLPALLASLSLAISRGTKAIDALSLSGNLSIDQARWGWLDTFGKLFNIIRKGQETDSTYRARIKGTLISPHTTSTSIVNFVKLSLGLDITVRENLVNTSYQILFKTPVSNATIQLVADVINIVRPAGVPFLPLFQQQGGLYISTMNYLAAKLVSGSYLSKPTISANINASAGTDSPQSILPTVFLADPLTFSEQSAIMLARAQTNTTSLYKRLKLVPVSTLSQIINSLTGTVSLTIGGVSIQQVNTTTASALATLASFSIFVETTFWNSNVWVKPGGSNFTINFSNAVPSSGVLGWFALVSNQTQTVAIPTSATSQIITIPFNGVGVIPIASVNWNTGFWISSLTGTALTVNFQTAAPSGAVFSLAFIGGNRVGSTTIMSGVTSATISLPVGITALPYAISVIPGWNTGVIITSKSTTSFTVAFSSSPTISSILYWVIFTY